MEALIFSLLQFSSVQFSHSVMSDSLQPHESQHARPPCPSPTPGVHSNSCPSRQWCHPAISSSVIPFSSCPQSLPASESFPMSQLFAWGGQSTGVSALASFLPKKSQGWSLLGRQDRELWTIMETSHKYVPSDIHTFFPLKWQNVHWLLYLQQSKWFLELKKTKNSFCAKKKKKMKSQGWSPLEWTGWISLQSKGLSRVFSNTTVEKHQFFSAQLSSQSNSHIHTWPQEKP